MREKTMDIGYIRVSSYDQHTDRQLDGIHLEKIYTDMISGKDTNRPELQKCLTALQHGDTLHVHSIDRLTRNLQDLLLLLSEMAERGVTVRFHKEKLTFSSDSSPFQKLHLQIIGAVAEFERAFIRERQREGIAIAKAKGKYKGRKRALSAEQLEEISRRIARESVSRIAEEYGVSRQTIYRSLRQNGEGGMRSVRDSRKGCTGLRHESLWHGRERRTHT
ncbi:resolvase [Desulfovibrionaceae bacterium]|nr:resolvase [Desulfovibrionaceae bacterium]